MKEMIQKKSKLKVHGQTQATAQEIHAALKLIELLYFRGEIPCHVYRNICAEYYSKGISATPCHSIGDTDKAAI